MSLPNLPSLTTKINKGSEGGLEFARLMNQLLFEDSRLNEYHFQSFSDSAGDYKGVDAIMETESSTIGLQYKFFEGNPKNKKALKQSLIRAIDKFPDMDEWVLVTPDNFTKHAMEWLDGLSTEFNIRIKHWGHSEILTLMLKFPQIGKKYYPKLYLYENQLISREPNKNEVIEYFNQFVDSSVDSKLLFFNAQPNLIDIKKIFTEDIYKEVSDFYYLQYRDLFDVDKSINETHLDKTITFYSSSVQEIKRGSSQLPGGMAHIIKDYDCFNPEIRFYLLRIHNAGVNLGITYSVWCFVNGRWIFLPKPWRVVPSIYKLRTDKSLNRLIKWLKFLGLEKSLRSENPNHAKIVINRIVHSLQSERKR